MSSLRPHSQDCSTSTPITFTGPFGQPNKVTGLTRTTSLLNAGYRVYSAIYRKGVTGWLFGDRKTSFRSGYGLGYDSYFNNITSNAAASAPNNYR